MTVRAATPCTHKFNRTLISVLLVCKTGISLATHGPNKPSELYQNETNTRASEEFLKHNYNFFEPSAFKLQTAEHPCGKATLNSFTPGHLQCFRKSYSRPRKHRIDEKRPAHPKPIERDHSAENTQSDQSAYAKGKPTEADDGDESRRRCNSSH